VSDPHDTAVKPCYDQQALMRRYDVIAEICDYMLELGWEAYQNDHEDATGQFEMNWKYDDGLRTADKHSFFKFMVRSIAEKHGLRATFMPKPFKGLTGSGCHAHISVWDLDGKKNAFADGGKELGLSDQGRCFLGGIMKHASALAAITNPTVNSYKRINAPRTISGATWAPNTVTGPATTAPTWCACRDRGASSCACPTGPRTPTCSRPSSSPRGLDGVRTKADPGKRHDIDMYRDGHTVTDAPRLPLNLLDALRDYDRDPTLKAMMGEEFSAAYVKLKTDEWNSYCAHFSEWERENTLGRLTGSRGPPGWRPDPQHRQPAGPIGGAHRAPSRWAARAVSASPSPASLRTLLETLGDPTRVAEIGDHRGDLLLLAQAGEGHLGARDVLARVGEEGRQLRLVPDQAGFARGLHRVAVLEVLERARDAAVDLVQLGADAVLRPFADRVAGGAASEHALSLGDEVVLSPRGRGEPEGQEGRGGQPQGLGVPNVDGHASLLRLGRLGAALGYPVGRPHRRGQGRGAAKGRAPAPRPPVSRRQEVIGTATRMAGSAPLSGIESGTTSKPQRGRMAADGGAPGWTLQSGRPASCLSVSMTIWLCTRATEGCGRSAPWTSRLRPARSSHHTRRR
jgi:hypothetical protein